MTALGPGPWSRALTATALAVLTFVLPGCASWPVPGGASIGSGASAPIAEAPAEPGGRGVDEPATSAQDAKTSWPAQAATGGSSSVAGPVARLGLDTLNPDSTVDFGTADVRRDLWQRIRDGYAMPDLSRPEPLQTLEQWYTARPEYLQRMMARGSRYLFHIVEEVQRRGMPTELALLPFIESAFNPQALSSAKASGIWQFMPATGRDFELRQNVFRDDRRDVLASTRAALDYLTRLHAQFGHWHLALAAYNWGEGNLQRAIQRNQRAGLPTDYESLRMPDETRRYVPKLMAIKRIVAQPQQYSLELPALENHPYFLSVPIDRDIDVGLAARLAGMSMDDFTALNPQYNKPVILAAGTPRILLPFDNAEQFINAVDKYRGNFASWTAWIAPRTLKPADAARLTGMSEAALREANRIPRGMLIRQGSALVVPRGPRQDDVSEKVADTASMNLQREVVVRPKAAAKPGKQTVQAKKTPSRPTAVASSNTRKGKPQQTAKAAAANKPKAAPSAASTSAPSAQARMASAGTGAARP